MLCHDVKINQCPSLTLQRASFQVVAFSVTFTFPPHWLEEHVGSSAGLSTFLGREKKRTWLKKDVATETRDAHSEWADSVTVDGWSHLSPSRLFWLPLLRFALEGSLRWLLQQPQTTEKRNKTQHGDGWTHRMQNDALYAKQLQFSFANFFFFFKAAQRRNCETAHQVQQRQRDGT